MSEATPLAPQARARVVSGKYKGQTVQVLSASESLAGCWNCVFHKDTGSGHRRQELVLTAGQLVVHPQGREAPP